MIDDNVFETVAERTRLFWDEERDAWRIAIPEKANLALDTVGIFATSDRRNHPALIYEAADGTVFTYSFADLDALIEGLKKVQSIFG